MTRSMNTGSLPTFIIGARLDRRGGVGASLVGVRRWRALVQPIFELMERVRKTPLFKNGAGHGRDGSGRFRCARQSALQQPCFEGFRVRIVLHRALEQIPLDRKSDRVGRLVTLAAAPASLGRFEGGEQRSADFRGPSRRWIQRRHYDQLQAKIDGFGIALPTTVTSSAYPAPSGRLYPCCIAAISKSTLARSSTMTLTGGLPCSVVKVFT